MKSALSRRHFVALSGLLALSGAAASASAALADESEGADAEAAPLFSQPGTYSSVAAGRNGEIVLEATFSADAIESIEITQSSETTSIGGQAFELLTKRALSAQTCALDLVSGATFSANAFIKALKDCAEQAGGDSERLSQAPEAASPDYTTEADFIVIGAGAAGLSAALTAVEAGAGVILLEKSGIYGGNTNAAVSGINVAGSDIQAQLGAPATLEDLYETQTNELARPELVEAFVNASGELADWLVREGVEFTYQERDPLQLKCSVDNANTGNVLVATLFEALSAYDSFSYYSGIEATSLVAEGGAVCGVLAVDKAGTEVEFSAKAVILATGGYGKNHDMVVEYRPDFANIATDEIAPTTGDGLVMAEPFDIQLVDMDQFSTFPKCIPGYSMLFPNLTPGGMSAPAGIFVNVEGKRFGDESQYQDADSLEQTDGAVYHIFPEAYANDTILNLIATGFAKQSQDIAELADLAGIDADALVETVATWNAGAADGVDTEYGRTDENVVPLEGNIMCYEFHDAVHYCMGGMLIDAQARVLTGADEPIPGLYAAGEVTGGFHGNTRVDGTGLADGFVFGRIAGKTAVEEHI